MATKLKHHCVTSHDVTSGLLLLRLVIYRLTPLWRNNFRATAAS